MFCHRKRLLLIAAASGITLASGQFSMAQEAARPKGVTRAQFEARQQTQFFKADKDANTLVSKQEFIAARPKGDPEKLGKRFDRVDANHDGSVDTAELAAMLDRRFNRLDNDGNGVLTAAERAAGRMPSNTQKSG